MNVSYLTRKKWRMATDLYIIPCVPSPLQQAPNHFLVPSMARITTILRYRHGQEFNDLANVYFITINSRVFNNGKSNKDFNLALLAV